MKKKLAIFIAVIAAMQALTIPASAVYVGHASNEPTEDPYFIEQSLEDFLNTNPDYVGVPEQVSTLTEIETTEGSYTWKQVGSRWQLFDPNGNQIINDWFQDYNNKWYYIGADGYMKTGWLQYGIYWYYFNGAGVMQVDWYQVGNKWYYFRTQEMADLYGGPAGGAMTGACYLPEIVGSTTCSRNYYFADQSDCSLQEFAYPLDKSRTENLRVNRGIRDKYDHNGLDINSYWNEQITSVADSKVIFSGFYGEGTSGTGGTVVQEVKLSDDSTVYVRYFHMNEVQATKGSISAGSNIGLVGNKGYVISSQTGPQAGKHLHIDVSWINTVNGTSISGLTGDEVYNPAAFFPNIEFFGANPFGANKN